MDDSGGFGPVQEPRLDDAFVLGARHREPSHRERQLEAERRRAAVRASRSRAEEDRLLAAARIDRRRIARPRPRPRPRSRTTGTGRERPRRLRGRQALGLAIVLAVVVAAALLPGPLSSGPPPLGPTVVAPQELAACPAGTYPADAQYRFEECADGAPVHRERCSALTVEIDPADAPATWRADTADALGQLGRATGLHVETTASTDADVTIAWAATLPAGGPDGADAAGVTHVGFRSGPGGASMTAAHIWIKAGVTAGETPGGEVPVLLHELGHAVGMGHYPGPDVMDPVDQGYGAYQPGDAAGLAALYQPLSCG